VRDLFYKILPRLRVLIDSKTIVWTKRTKNRMGGIVTHPGNHTEPHTQEEAMRTLSNKVSQSIRDKDIALTLNDFPLLPYEEVQELLPLCVQSWNYIVTTRVGSGRLLGDCFQIYAYDGLCALKGEMGSSIASILGDAREKKSFNPITYVMRYCIKTRRHSEAQFKKKLQLLGREHARVGVHAEMITQFCMVLLTAFAACFGDGTAVDAIMYAWIANLKYIVTHMTNLRFSFLRVISGEVKCSKCGCCSTFCACMMSSSGHFDALSTDDTTAFSRSSSMSMSRDNLMSFAYDGLDHSCHPIFEGYSNKDVSFLFQAEHSLFGACAVPVAGPQQGSTTVQDK
jgi:hypothetical protein